MSTSFFIIYTLLCFLFVLAIVLLALSKYQRRQSVLPEGEIIYEDVSELAKEPLYSQRTSLSGKPDYLLKGPNGNLIPVEVKSGYAPKDNQPYESHLRKLMTRGEVHRTHDQATSCARCSMAHVCEERFD